MPVHRLSDPKINELSLIFGAHKGQEWEPRNPGATVLGMKAAPTGAALQPTFLSKLVDVFKGKSQKGWLVNDDQTDNVDGDGDGGQDYEQLVNLVLSVGSDLQQAMWINDDDARSMAIATALDNFKKNMDDVYSGGDGTVTRKAGARHSKADADHIAAIGDAAKKASDAADAIKGHVDALSSSSADDKDDSKTGDGAKKDDGMGSDDASKGAPANGARAEAITVPIVAAVDASMVDTMKAALAESTLSIKAMLEEQNTKVEKALEAQAATIDAKFEAHATELATKAAESETAVSAIKASVNAIVAAARAPQAPGALTSLEPDGSRKGAPILGTSETPALPDIPVTMPATGKNGAVQTLLRAQRPA